MPVDQIIRLEKSSGIVIGKIKALVFDRGTESRCPGRAYQGDELPIGLGDESRMDYFVLLIPGHHAQAG